MAHTTPRRLLFPFLALFVSLISTTLPPASVVAGVALTAEPGTLSLTVPLGERVDTTIRLRNNSGEPVTALVYEARNDQPPTLLKEHVPARVELPQQANRLDPQLQANLRAAGDGRADFILYLRDQADLSAAYAIPDWKARGEYVYQALYAHAEQSQHTIRRQLQAQGLPFQPLWIVNAVITHGTLADAEALAAHADVAMVRANHVTALSPGDLGIAQSTADRCSPDAPGNPSCWGIRTIAADRVWSDFGVNGRGVVVANIDSGVAYSHSALAQSYRGYQSAGTYDHNYNWFDPQGARAEPFDDNGHGTHTMGTMIGIGNGTVEHPAIGVAPGARWVAAQGCEAVFCTESDLISAAQWVLAPADLNGLNPRPDLRPMIVNNSWAGTGGNKWYAGYTAAWRAAGIFPVFAGGNGNPQQFFSCGSIASPGDYADVLAVGASARDDTIAPFSLLGPSLSGTIKPDFVAPGTYVSGSQGIYSTYIGDGSPYQTLQGTSMAAPHVAGVIALLWSANPALIGDYDATYAILRETAHPLPADRCGGDPSGVPNNVFGHGRIDSYAAVARARVDVPWLITTGDTPQIGPGATADLALTLAGDLVPAPGIYTARIQIFENTLGAAPTTIPVAINVVANGPTATVSGRVLNADTGQPLAANIGVRNAVAVPVDASGNYSLTLKPGTYELVATAPAFLPGARTLTLSADQADVDFLLLPDQPRIAVSSDPISATLGIGDWRGAPITIENRGTSPLNYRIAIPQDAFSVWRSDQPDGPAYNWVELPPDAPTLELVDNGYKEDVPLGILFPFFNHALTETLVTSNGILAFDRPLQYTAPDTRCLPDNQIFFYAIVPFRADLDPSRGGTIRYGTLPDQKTFVINYEQIPLHTGPESATYTFQVLMHDDGRIVFQYRELAALPNQLSVGIQRHPGRVQDIGCGATTPISNELAIELRPQTPSHIWLSSDHITGQVPPGEQRKVYALLNWARPGQPGIYQGRVNIFSDDPTQPLITVTAKALLQPAPHEAWLVFVPNSP